MEIFIRHTFRGLERLLVVDRLIETPSSRVIECIQPSPVVIFRKAQWDGLLTCTVVGTFRVS